MVNDHISDHSLESEDTAFIRLPSFHFSIDKHVKQLRDINKNKTKPSAVSPVGEGNNQVAQVAM